MPISSVADLWGFERRQNQWGEDSRGCVIDLCRWRAKHATAPTVQEVMAVATAERFAERG